jgi:4-hydroxybenzoate polyprenyltransferase
MENGWMSSPAKRARPFLAALFLIRPLNLLFIALTQYLILFHFLFPVFLRAGASPTLQGALGWAFIATTVLLAAAGYVINDLYDVAADRINKPRKWWVGREISPKWARRWALLLLLMGGVLAAWIAYDLQQLCLWAIYPAVAFLLWAYSGFFKGAPLAGNLLVALLCGLVAGIVWYAEREGFRTLLLREPALALRAALALGFYLLFAFLATLFREIVKDCEDVEGDSAARQRTLPVMRGIPAARRWALATGIVLETALLALAIWLGSEGRLLQAALLLLVLAAPMALALQKVQRARSPEQFRTVSHIAKWVIFAGVFLILLFA